MHIWKNQLPQNLRMTDNSHSISFVGSGINDVRTNSTRSFDRGSARTNSMPARTATSFSAKDEPSPLERYKLKRSEEVNDTTPTPTPTRLKKQVTEPSLSISSFATISAKIPEVPEPVKLKAKLCNTKNREIKKSSSVNEELSSLEKIRQRRQELIEKKAEIAERKTIGPDKKTGGVVKQQCDVR